MVDINCKPEETDEQMAPNSDHEGNDTEMIHQTWGSKVDYFMTMLGFAVGLGTLFKWPYLCMRNGGGVFLIPYTIVSIIGTIPCVFLEMTIGQYSQSGAVTVWNFCPSLKGVGVGTIMIALIFTTCGTTMLSWFIYYFYYSFSTNIPWAHCGNEWNTPTCISNYGFINQTMRNTTSLTGANEMTANSSSAGSVTLHNSRLMNGSALPGLTAAEEFWRFKVLELTDGLEDIGDLRGVLAGCLAITYILIYLCMFLGIKFSGKVVYVTVILPYILLTVFLVRGCLLPGSADGIYYYIFPKFDKLLDPKIWLEASGFALYGLGTGWGCLITMAGHNKANNNCLGDAVLVTVIDSLATVYCGFALFSIMGHGFNLGFIAYPEAVASLPLPQLWSALTFVLMFTLGIDSVIPCFETAVTAVMEQFPSLSHRRRLISFVVLLLAFLISLISVTQGGLYVVTLVEWFAFFPSMLVFIFLECVIVSWIYGTDRLNEDIVSMWGKQPPRVISISLRFICPVICMVLFSYSLYSYRPPKYDDYTYPGWGAGIGWIIAFSSIIPIPVVFIFTVLFSYSLYSYRPPKYDDYTYPGWGAGIGWIIAFSSIIPIPVVFIFTVYKTEGQTLKQKLWNSMQPNKKWGHSRLSERTEEDSFRLTSSRIS